MVNKRFVRKCQNQSSTSNNETANAVTSTIEQVQAACLGLGSLAANLMRQVIQALSTVRLQETCLGWGSATANLFQQMKQAPSMLRLQAACLGLGSLAANLMRQVMHTLYTLRLRETCMSLGSATANLIQKVMQAPAMLRLQAACLGLLNVAANLFRPAVYRLKKSIRENAYFKAAWDSIASHAVLPRTDDSVGEVENPGIVQKLQGLAKGLKIAEIGEMASRNVLLKALAFTGFLIVAFHWWVQDDTATFIIKHHQQDAIKPSIVTEHRGYLANCTNNDMVDGLKAEPGGPLDGLTAVVDVSKYTDSSSSLQPTKFTMAIHPMRYDLSVGKTIYSRGCFDCELWNQTLSTLARHKDAFFLDIGSNIGIFGLSAAAMGVDVYAFEPFKKNWRRICQTLKLNPFLKDRMTLFQAALSSKGPQKISYIVPRLNPAGLQVVTGGQNQNVPANAEEGVDYGWAVALDSLQDSLPKNRPVVIKLDVEGHECEVLAGGMNYLSQLNIVQVIMRMSPEALRQCDNRQAVFGLFTKNKLSPTKWVQVEKVWLHETKPLDMNDLTEWYSGEGKYKIEWAQ